MLIMDKRKNNQEIITVTGKVVIGNNVVKSADCIVRDSCITCDNIIIEDPTFIASYTSIGNNSKIMKASIQNSIIMGKSNVKTIIGVQESVSSRGSITGRIYKHRIG